MTDGSGGPPPNQGEDKVAYRIAVGAIGVALVAFLIGASVIAAGGNPVPTEYWTTGSAISGALLGILAPTPKKIHDPTPQTMSIKKAFSSAVAMIEDLWTNRALFILLAIFGVSIAFAIDKNSAELQALAAGAGGALVGLLAPTPGSKAS